MDKSEKSFYVIIKNKKCGKFSGASPIQVAKKVASKKLKAGKEIEFYLDEAGGKNKRYGPYQARKDKKSGKVSVVKGRKVMKGGLLSISDREILTSAFNNNNQIDRSGFIKPVNVNIKYYSKYPPFIVNSLLIFFKKNNKEQPEYTHAIFVEQNGIYIWILQKGLNGTVSFINFCDFFLNPDYLNFLDIDIKYILNNLNDITSSLIIRQREGNILKGIVEKIHSVVVKGINKICYLPDYSHPLIRKYVYPDLAFGILNEETPARIPQNINSFPTPESPYQRFLILTNTGMSGMSVNEPIIYVRVPIIPKIENGGMQTKITEIDNYLHQIDILINKINIRNNIGLTTSMNNMKLVTETGIKKMNNHILQLERSLKKESNIPNGKETQLIRLNELKIFLQQQKLQILQPHQLQNQFSFQQQIKNQFSFQQQLEQKHFRQQLEQLHLQQQLKELQFQKNQTQIKPRNQNQQFQQIKNRSKLQEEQRAEQIQQLQQFKKIQTLQKNHQLQLQTQIEQQFHFDCCIFSSGYNQLKIMFYDNTTQNFSLDNIIQLININTTIIQNLIDIPPEFGNFRRIRNLIETIKNRQRQQQLLQQRQRQQYQLNQLIRIQRSLPQINIPIQQQLTTNISPVTLEQNGVNQLTRLLQFRLRQQQQQKLQNNRNREIQQLEDKKRELKKKLKSATNNNDTSNLSEQISIIRSEIQRLTLESVP